MYLISDKSAWNLDSENGGGKVRLGGQVGLFFPILLQQYPHPFHNEWGHTVNSIKTSLDSG